MIGLLLWLAMISPADAHGASETPAAPPVALVTVGAGALPIVITAPHGGRQAIAGVPERRGNGVPQFTVRRDNNTAELTHLLAARLAERLGARPFMIVADFERKYIDANRSPQQAYEVPGAKIFYDHYHGAVGAAVVQVKRQWGHGFLIDVHGQTAEEESIFRGTDNRATVQSLIERHGIHALSGPKSILGLLHATGYRVLPDLNGQDRERQYTGGYTTRTYGSHRGTQVDAMQLELGTNLRRKANLERTASDLAQAIAIFAKEYLPLAEGANTKRGGSPVGR
jgi:N-formylglutamate amidohydrolase